MSERKAFFAVVLNWETETDTGYSPVMVGVYANDTEEALDIAIAQAESGALFKHIYAVKDDEEAQSMDIHRDSSFATLVDKISPINPGMAPEKVKAIYAGDISVKDPESRKNMIDLEVFKDPESGGMFAIDASFTD
jgi:hypothetical protein